MMVRGTSTYIERTGIAGIAHCMHKKETNISVKSIKRNLKQELLHHTPG